MTDERTTARLVGVLFILATVAAIAGGVLVLPVEESGYLSEAAARNGQVVAGMLLEVVLAVSVVAIAVALYPILRKGSSGLALGYVAARTAEGLLALTGVIGAALVLDLSALYGPAGAEVAQPLGDLVIAARQWSYLMGPTLMFSISALILYPLLYRMELVPSWLSLWGLAGGVTLLISALLEFAGVTLGGWQAVFSAPIGVQEMVLAWWLIARGFTDRSAAHVEIRDGVMV